MQRKGESPARCQKQVKMQLLRCVIGKMRKLWSAGPGLARVTAGWVKGKLVIRDCNLVAD